MKKVIILENLGGNEDFHSIILEPSQVEPESEMCCNA